MAYELTGKMKLIQEPKTFASGFTCQRLLKINPFLPVGAEVRLTPCRVASAPADG